MDRNRRSRSARRRAGEPQLDAERQTKADLPLPPRKLGTSLANHPGRLALATARLQARVDAERKNPDARKRLRHVVQTEADFDDPKWVDHEVDRRLTELASYSHPKTPKYIAEFGPDPTCRSKRPADANDLIEVQAMRELPYWKVLEDVLSTRTDNMGTPSERKLTVAMYGYQVLTARPKVLKAAYEELTSKDDLLDHAFGHPIGDGAHARAYNSVTVGLSSQLDHHDPETLVAINGALLRQRAAQLGERYGRHVVLDGMKWQAHLLQHKGYNDVERQLLKRGFSSAEFGYHGPGEGWRGFTLLALRDLHSLDILGWMLAPANQREHGCVEALMLRVFEHFPEWRPEVLIADREYDVEALYTNLLSRFGVHLICPLRETLSDAYLWAATQGVPACSQHGLMRRVRDREFPDQDYRQREGLRPGEAAPVDRARTDWKCSDGRCPARETTYFKRNPRLFGMHPRRGDHKYVAMREAWQVLRNVAESTNASLEYRGFGLKGQARAKWVSTDAQAEWLAGGGLFAMNLRQLIHGPDGPYERLYEEAKRRGFIKPRSASPGALTGIDGGLANAGTAAAVGKRAA